MNLSIKQFAEKAGVKRDTIHRRIREGKIETIPLKIRGTWWQFIDTDKFPPIKYGAKKRGRPKKKQK